MDRIEINVGGRDFVFSVKFEHDACAGTPWENCDGHGPVTDFLQRSKRPGELVLNTDWGVETRGDYHHEQARLLADDLARGFGVRWDKQTVCKEQYVWMR